MASPMKRALETIKPLAAAVNKPVLVHPESYEIGGLYRKGPDGVFYGAPGLSTREISDRVLPQADARMLPAGLAWNHAALAEGKETTAQAAARAERLASWLRSEVVGRPPSSTTGGQRTLVMVSHSDFIGLTIKALLGLPVRADPALHTDNVSLTHLFLPPAPAADAAGHGDHGVLRYLNRPAEAGDL